MIKRLSFRALGAFLCAFPMLEATANEYGSFGATGLGVAIALLWLFQSIQYGTIKVGVGLHVLLIFCLWMLFTAFWSESPSTSAAIGFAYLMSFVFYLIVIDLISSRKDIFILMACYAVGVLALATTALFNISSLNTYAELSNRYSATGTDPNNFGMMLALAMPLLFMLSMDAGKRLKALVFCTLAVFAFLIGSTASRAATVSMVVVFICALIISTRKRAKVSVVIGAAVFFGAAFYSLIDLIPQEAYDRLIFGLNAVGDDDRFHIWEVLLDAREISIFGVGAGLTFEKLGVQAHNTFLSALYEGGLLGFLFWLFFWIMHAGYLYRAWKAEKNVVSMYLICSYLVLLVAACTLNWEFRKPLYLMMAIYAAWYRVLVAEKKGVFFEKVRSFETNDPLLRGVES